MNTNSVAATVYIDQRRQWMDASLFQALRIVCHLHAVTKARIWKRCSLTWQDQFCDGHSNV